MRCPGICVGKKDVPSSRPRRTAFDQDTIGRLEGHWTQEEAASDIALMLRAEEDVLAYKTFDPQAHRKYTATNPLERLNKEIKRRHMSSLIFPNEAATRSLFRVNDEWAVTLLQRWKPSLCHLRGYQVLGPVASNPAPDAGSTKAIMSEATGAVPRLFHVSRSSERRRSHTVLAHCLVR